MDDDLSKAEQRWQRRSLFYSRRRRRGWWLLLLIALLVGLGTATYSGEIDAQTWFNALLEMLELNNL